MTIRVGTVVTPFDPDIMYKTCKGYDDWENPDTSDICVGIVTFVENGDNPVIIVKWLNGCKDHGYYIQLRNEQTNTQAMPLDELWEIGQLY